MFKYILNKTGHSDIVYKAKSILLNFTAKKGTTPKRRARRRSEKGMALTKKGVALKTEGVARRHAKSL